MPFLSEVMLLYKVHSLHRTEKETSAPCLYCCADLSEDTALMQSGCDDQVCTARLS